MDWLEKQIKSELDLGFRPKKKSQFIYKNDEPVAHFSLSKRGRLFELTTVVVDKSFRNQGITYEILEKCTQPSMVFTRNDFLKKALLNSGYQRRKWAGFIPSLFILIDRIYKFASMVLRLDFKRLFHQIRHLHNYKLYIRE